MAKKKKSKKKSQTKSKKATQEKAKNEESSEKVTKSIQNEESKQTIWIFLIILILFSSFFVPYFYFKSQRIFDYNGVTWQVEKDGEITFYHTQFEKVINNQSVGFHNTFFRNDPRTNNIPIEVSTLAFYRAIAITSSPEVLECDKQILVTDALSQITLALPLYDKIVIPGISDEDLANKSNRDYITCTNKPPQTTVINVIKGSENKVTEDLENKCYTISIADCEDNLLVAEKFIAETIKQLND